MKHSIRFLFFFLVLPHLFFCAKESFPVFQVDSLSPRFAFHGQENRLNIRGKGFLQELSGWLQNEKGDSFRFSKITIESEEKIQIELPKDLPVGGYSLYLAYPQQEGQRVEGSFDLYEPSLLIFFLNADQGDATLLVSPSGKNMLIDGGREEQGLVLFDTLRYLGIQKIDYVVATHYDEDHVGGFQKVFWGGTSLSLPPSIQLVEKLIDGGGWSKNSKYREFKEKWKDKVLELPGKTASSFPVFSLGNEIQVSVRTTQGVLKKNDGTLESIDCKGDENCESIGTLVTVGGFRFWTAGDLTGGGNKTPDMETSLAKELGKIHVYRAHHHGSNTSSNEDFLKALEPDVVVISAGKNNSYCHPNETMLERLSKNPLTWVFVTTAGVQTLSKCSQTTQTLLAPFQERSLLNAGILRVSATSSSFWVHSTEQGFRKKWLLPSP